MIGWFEDYHQLHKYYLDEHLIKLREVEEFDDKNPILQEMMQRISLCNYDIKIKFTKLLVDLEDITSNNPTIFIYPQAKLQLKVITTRI